MDHPVREIASVITTLTTGSPQQQAATLHDYFLEDASFSHPFCYVPPFKKGSIPFARNTDSLWVLLCIYRWYRTLSPTIDITIDSAVLDQRTNTLYCNIHQTFAIWFLWPLYSIRVRLVTVLHLAPRTVWPADETVTKKPIVEGTKPSSKQTTAAVSEAAAATDPSNGLVKYYIAAQEDFYQMNDCVQFLTPRFGHIVWTGWQLFSTLLCVIGSVLLLPLYFVLNRSKTAKKVA